MINHFRHEKKAMASTPFSSAFTIVELLVVIVVIGTLAAITIVSYTGIQSRAQNAKITADLAQLSRAIQAAQITTQKTMGQITGSYYSASSCITQPSDTDLSALPRTSTCWVQYLSDLNIISTNSGINVKGLTDPWGRPYFIDENEGEGGGCSRDSISTYSEPFITGQTGSGLTAIPLSGYSGCAI